MQRPSLRCFLIYELRLCLWTQLGVMTSECFRLESRFVLGGSEKLIIKCDVLNWLGWPWRSRDLSKGKAAWGVHDPWDLKTTMLMSGCTGPFNQSPYNRPFKRRQMNGGRSEFTRLDQRESFLHNYNLPRLNLSMRKWCFYCGPH